ncbi:endonuclease domain-containing protein [Corynebacterium sp. Marseille-P4321]|uniref:endonuclease domain-containing protein n=1 Tax=Corynebacterium sp. Marseille-P4321 TaxID=2736603 RepID=UPI00158EA03D|nr:DUF559 domain-containing protein [Corynebacterium sp. Marseille-P4321]
MNHAELVGLLIRRSNAALQVCHGVSTTRFVPADAWQKLPRHEKEYLRCYAAALSANKAVLVGRSAARVGGMWVIPTNEELVELGARGRSAPSKSQWPVGVVYRHGEIPDIDVRTVDALRGAGPEPAVRLTTLPRTAVDIARFHGLRHGVVAMDSVFHGRKPHEMQVLRAEVELMLQRLAGKRHIAVAREAFTLSSPVSGSPYESLLRIILIEHEIKVDEQMWIGRDYRVDFLWGTLVIEVDGYAKFDLKPHEALINQLERENWIKEKGFEVIRLFPVEILRDPEGCIARIRAAKQLADARPATRIEPSRQRPSGPRRGW